MPKSKRPSKRSPPPAAKRSRGRPVGTGYKPTDEQRDMVRLASALGIPEDQIVHAIRNPKTRHPISPVTLRRHFRKELDRGLVEANLKAGSNLLTLTATSAAAAIFWAKVRLHWREGPRGDAAAMGPIAGSAAAQADEKSLLEIARRMAYVLHKGAALAAPPPPEPAKKAA